MNAMESLSFTWTAIKLIGWILFAAQLWLSIVQELEIHWLDIWRAPFPLTRLWFLTSLPTGRVFTSPACFPPPESNSHPHFKFTWLRSNCSEQKCFSTFFWGININYIQLIGQSASPAEWRFLVWQISTVFMHTDPGTSTLLLHKLYMFILIVLTALEIS